MAEALSWGAYVFGIVGGIAIVILAVKNVEREEAADVGQGWFRPVGVPKFLLLNTVSIGLYAIYWFWRCWRRHRFTEEADLSPLWRALFAMFYIVSLFRAANDKSAKKWPIWIAVVSTAIIVVTTVASNFAIRDDVPFWQTELVGVLSTVAFVPLVMQINRVNALEFVTERSRFSKLEWYVLVCGTPLWIALMLGLP